MSASSFIVLEGIDGSGTTTQCQLLCEELRRQLPDREIVRTREPYDPHLTRRIRTWLREDSPSHHTLLLAFALDRQVHLEEVVRPALERGAIVVCDRYKLSTSAYQRQHNPWHIVEALLNEAPNPDLSILLDVPPETAAARIASRSVTPDVYERSVDFQRKVGNAYRDAANHAIAEGLIVPTLDTRGLTILDTHFAVTRTVNEHLQL